MNDVGRLLVLAGAILVVVGLVLVFFDRVPLVGRLPGDFVIRRRNLTIYLPLATSVVLSVILTVLLRLFSRR